MINICECILIPSVAEKCAITRMGLTGRLSLWLFPMGGRLFVIGVCAYTCTVLQTQQRSGVQGAVHGTVHYCEVI